MSLLRSHAPLSLLVSALSACSIAQEPLTQSQNPSSEVRYVMGTLLDITVYSQSEASARAILNDAFTVAEELDALLSLYKPESPASRFNHLESGVPFQAPPALCEVVSTSKALCVKTDGAFDITVRPLVELWDHAANTGTLPSRADHTKTRRLISPSLVTISTPCALTKKSSGVALETGGIGKGFAVDKIVALLRERGVSAAFINFGRSSIAAIGTPPGQRGWPVALQLTAGAQDQVIFLRDETLSISRARGTPFKVAGVEYSHVFDPQTARPVPVSRGAAVRGSSATEGEAFVKYLVIRGAPSQDVHRLWGDTQWTVHEPDAIHTSPRFDAPPSTPQT